MAGWTGAAGRRFTAIFGGQRQPAITFAVGLVVLLLVQIPIVERSFLGQPDREMMEAAFKLRSDVLNDRATPALLLDIDDRTLSEATGGTAQPFKAPAVTTPRVALAELLEFIRTSPPASAPRAVILDVDVAAQASDGDVGTSSLAGVLTAWAATPTAPPLIMVREAFAAETLGMEGDIKVLPDTPYEAIVQPAPNIFWASAKVLSDQNGVAREFLPFECVLTRQGVKPLYSSALIAYGFVETDEAARDRSPALAWIDRGREECARNPAAALRHGERINYHLSLDLAFHNRVWPNLSKAWPGRAACGGGDAAVFRRQSAGDILAAMKAGAEISRDLLCQRLVIIGGTNGVAGDFVQTPLNEMSGSVALVNAVRGMQLSKGGLKAIPLPLQIAILLVICLAMSAASVATDRARDEYIKHTRGDKRGFIWRIALLPLNPLVLNGAIAFAAHWLGVLMLLGSLNFGVWGFLSAPVFAAALAESIQEFTDAIES